MEDKIGKAIDQIFHYIDREKRSEAHKVINRLCDEVDKLEKVYKNTKERLKNREETIRRLRMEISKNQLEKLKRKKLLKELKEVRKKVFNGEILYCCESCKEVMEEDEVAEIRECPHCSDTFDASDAGGRECPYCNRPFTSVVTHTGCANCIEELTELTKENIDDIIKQIRGK